MAELHSRVSLRHNEARRQTMGSQPLLHQHTHTMEDNIADGTYTVDDDTQGFFAKGREFESVGDAHTYTAKEKEMLASYESLEYLPPNNRVYREYLTKSSDRPSSTSRWIAMFCIGASTGVVGFLLKSIIERIGDWRRSLIFDVDCVCKVGTSLSDEEKAAGNKACTATGTGAVGQGAILQAYSCGAAYGEGGGTAVDANGMLFPVFAGVAITFAFAAAAVVIGIQPAAASSGIPEVIAYLNGTHQRKIFNVKTLVIKFISCFLAVGSGLPVGPEGPMIHMGAMVGRGVSQMRSRTLGCAMPVFKHFRNNKDARDFLSAGAAAGVSSAFGAPVGGLLFSLEEVASTWSQTLTWQTFFCSMTAATVTLVLAASFGSFEYNPPFGALHAGGAHSSIEFYVADSINMNILLFFPTILIGATCGVLGALFTFINLKWAKFRRRAIAPVKALRVLEPMVIMLLFASLSVLLPLAFGCTSASKAHPGLLEEGALVRLSCPAGSYNELATLVYASGHKAVLLLFSRRAESLQPDNTLAYVGRETFGGGSVAVFFVIYYVLAAVSAGSAISSGLVVPMLLIGACIGRLYGILVLGALGQADDPLTHCEGPHPWPTACYYSYVDPGACALIGAAAFFGGVSRLTIALTVIMIEITNDIRFLLPIMLSVMVAKWVADSITHSLYHAIIEAKCLPFLNPEVTLHGAKDGDLERFTIADLLKVVQHGPVMSLSAGAAETLGSVARLLQETRHGAYPVLDVHGRFEGTVSRDQLIAVLAEAASGGGSPDAFTRDPNGNGYLALLTAAEEANHGEYEAALERCATDPSLSGKPCDLSAYVNASAFSLRSNFSLHRAYMLFRTMGLRHLIVTDVENLVVGVITRRDLMDFQLHEVLHPHGHGHH